MLCQRTCMQCFVKIDQSNWSLLRWHTHINIFVVALTNRISLAHPTCKIFINFCYLDYFIIRDSSRPHQLLLHFSSISRPPSKHSSTHWGSRDHDLPLRTPALKTWSDKSVSVILRFDLFLSLGVFSKTLKYSFGRYLIK